MEISYTIKSRKGSRNIRIAVHEGGEVVVTKPRRVSEREVEVLMEKKKDWIMEKVEEMRQKPRRLLAHYSAKDFKEHKERAYELTEKKVTHFNQFYKYPISKICIRNQKTRWGSCSSKKNLNFNYKIVFLPEALQDYLIVHELCHLKEMNHSDRFWALVAQQIPDYKILQKQLKLY